MNQDVDELHLVAVPRIKVTEVVPASLEDNNKDHCSQVQCEDETSYHDTYQESFVPPG